MPLSKAAISAYQQKQKIFKMPLTLILIFMLQASFVPILKLLAHLAQFLNVTVVLTYNAGQNNLAKTSDCIFLIRKGDFLELPPPPSRISMFFLWRLSVNVL